MQPVLQNPAVVASFYSVHEAELACAQLIGSGIPARVEGQHSVGVLPMHAVALGGVRVVVEAADLERARELLAATTGDGASTEEPAIDGDDEPEPIAADGGDYWMRSAAFAGFLGITMCPLVGTLYSLILLARYSALPRTQRGDLHRRLALGFDAVAVAFAIAWRVLH